MHVAAFNFVRTCVDTLPPRKIVLEYGGRDINGSVKMLFNRAADYLSIDIVAGPGVDKVADASTFVPRKTPDTVVCCEVLEHSEKWPEIVKAAGRVLDPVSGVLILTCACNPRAPHSAVDGAEVRRGEYYGNVDPLEFTSVLDQAGFETHTTECTDGGDLQCIAWKVDPK